MLKLGLGSADITPTESVPMGGYADRVGASTGVHDPLKVYAWLFGNEDDDPWIWFVLDLCLMEPASCKALAANVGKLLGADEDKLLVSFDHTHSGPDVCTLADGAQPWEQRYFDHLASAMAQAARAAMADAFIGTIAVRAAECDAGVNRRRADGPVDEPVDDAGRAAGGVAAGAHGALDEFSLETAGVDLLVHVAVDLVEHQRHRQEPLRLGLAYVGQHTIG